MLVKLPYRFPGSLPNDLFKLRDESAPGWNIVGATCRKTDFFVMKIGLSLDKGRPYKCSPMVRPLAVDGFRMAQGVGIGQGLRRVPCQRVAD